MKTRVPPHRSVFIPFSSGEPAPKRVEEVFYEMSEEGIRFVQAVPHLGIVGMAGQDGTIGIWLFFVQG
jgi:hypothetical protein